MPNIQVLNSAVHGGVGVNSGYGPGLGYEQGAVMVLPHEVRAVQREYPMVFRKHPETGQFFLVALLGFAQDENLYLDGAGNWRADYIPHAFSKGPFLISFAPGAGEGAPGPEDGASGAGEGDGEAQAGGQRPVISIDMDDPRVGPAAHAEKHTEKLFDAEGGQSPYLRKINDILAQMHQSAAILRDMIDAFLAAELIEPLSLAVQTDGGEKIRINGAATIAEEKLSGLDAKALAELNGKNYLSAAYYIAGSIENVNKLIKFRGERT